VPHLSGRVAVITGGGRGLGREYALLFAREGARVVVNDLGGDRDGSGANASPADEVVDEILAAGGEAVANHDDVADWEGARRIFHTALDRFGDLHVVVNNAGILRDRSIVSMTEADWDVTLRVHLRGHIAVTKWAAEHWRAQAKQGDLTDRALINTSSTSGLIGNFGQSAYGAAKAGIAAMTVIAQIELGQYGVRCNAIAPAARTRLTTGQEDAAGAHPLLDGAIDDGHPANVAAVVAYLATESCPLKGLVLLSHGRSVRLLAPWTPVDLHTTEQPWTFASLKEELDPLAGTTFTTLADLFPS
jgi:NAD(P)-dependent dehydrogenase (short-subunit alcohol dehydrogenase family)